jgi:hypothetical protein
MSNSPRHPFARQALKPIAFRSRSCDERRQGYGGHRQSVWTGKVASFPDACSDTEVEGPFSTKSAQRQGWARTRC